MKTKVFDFKKISFSKNKGLKKNLLKKIGSKKNGFQKKTQSQKEKRGPNYIRVSTFQQEPASNCFRPKIYLDLELFGHRIFLELKVFGT